MRNVTGFTISGRRQGQDLFSCREVPHEKTAFRPAYAAPGAAPFDVAVAQRDWSGDAKKKFTLGEQRGVRDARPSGRGKKSVLGRGRTVFGRSRGFGPPHDGSLLPVPDVRAAASRSRPDCELEAPGSDIIAASFCAGDDADVRELPADRLCADTRVISPGPVGAGGPIPADR